MARRHLDAETLQRIAARDLDRAELRAAGWHLYKCRRCRGRLRQALDDGDLVLERLFAGHPPVDVFARPEYRSAFTGAVSGLAASLASRRQQERLSAGWLDEVLALPASWRVQAVERHPERATWSFAEGLLVACQKSWSGDAAEAAELASLALRTLSILRRGEPDARSVDRDLLADLEARAWAYLGNCRRLRSDLRGGAEAFRRALLWVERGTGDGAERGRILDLHASLLRAQRHFAEADQALEQAIRLYGSVGDEGGVARVLIKQAMTAGYAGDLDRAVELDRRALELLAGQRNPRLHLTATHNLLQDLFELGRYDEAQDLLAEARRLEEAHGDAVDRLRIRWFEGNLARDTGNAAAAEEALLAARQSFIEMGMPYEAALVSLDLAVLYTEQGRSSETRELAREMLPIFQSQDVGREALATLMLFQQAALADSLTARLAREVAVAMRHGRSLVALRNPPPS